jgi:tetratricopeptide (TPR) repeat protein
MKLFGFFNIKKENKFKITEPDREWVEDNFKWMIQAYGYPSRQSQQILLNENSFPNTFKAQKINIQDIIADLSTGLLLDSSKISFEYVEDLRDSFATPYEIEGGLFETSTEIAEGNYKIFIAKSLLKHPKRLIFSLIFEFIKIRLTESKLEFETGEDTNLFIYLAGIYLGFGVILSQNMTYSGASNDGFWQSNWRFVAEIPEEVMVFALATYSKLIEQNNPVWKTELPKPLYTKFEKAIAYLDEYPSALFSKGELEAQDLFRQSMEEYEKNDFDAAISTLQKVLFLTNDELLRAEIFNDIGYNLTRKGEFEPSIPNFLKTLEIEPKHGIASDNLAYSLIRLGRLEDGKRYADHAIATMNNDPAYSYRNLALYYQATGESKLAEKNFQLAFDNMTETVDMLNQHYGEFLIEQGREEEAREYLAGQS